MYSLNDSWFFIMSVSTFGYPRIVAYLQLPVAFRSLSRPSSAPCAKAFTLCSCSLELPCAFQLVLVLLNCLSFINIFRLLILFVKRLPFRYFELFFPPFGEIVHIFSMWFLPYYLRKTKCYFKLISLKLFVLFSISVRFYSSIYFIRFSMII